MTGTRIHVSVHFHSVMYRILSASSIIILLPTRLVIHPSNWSSNTRNTKTPFTRYNRLSNPFDNRFDNRVERTAVQPRLHDTTYYQTGCQTRLTTGLTNGCIVYTAGCQTDCTTRFDNRLNEQKKLVKQQYLLHMSSQSC